jgi:hypothetical protein
MLAKRRSLKVGESSEVKTPLLLPSFSSKGFPNVSEILETMEEFISDEVLVSAYDVHFQTITPPFDFASLVFLDSGGYEVSKEYELSETYEGKHVPETWTIELYTKVIQKWQSLSPTIFVSFDTRRIEFPPLSRSQELEACLCLREIIMRGNF